MKQLLIILSILILGGCSTIQALDDTIRPKLEQANDAVVDESRQVICNNVYRAERDFIERNNIQAETFNEFCGRDTRRTRTE